MTDYLELLLEEQEAEEKNQVSERKRWKMPTMNLGGRAAQRSEVNREHSTGQTREKARIPQREEASEKRISVGKSSEQPRDLTVELLRLRRATQLADARNNHAIVQGGGTYREPSSFLTMRERQEFKAVDYAALVDAAFARDARRYDGLPGLL